MNGSHRTEVKDDPCSGCPSMSTDDTHVWKVIEIVRASRKLTIQDIAGKCNISVDVMKSGQSMLDCILLPPSSSRGS